MEMWSPKGGEHCCDVWRIPGLDSFEEIPLTSVYLRDRADYGLINYHSSCVVRTWIEVCPDLWIDWLPNLSLKAFRLASTTRPFCRMSLNLLYSDLITIIRNWYKCFSQNQPLAIVQGNAKTRVHTGRRRQSRSQEQWMNGRSEPMSTRRISGNNTTTEL